MADIKSKWLPVAGEASEGIVTTSPQTFAGKKAFNDGVMVDVLSPSADSVTALQITKANGTTPVMNVDTANNIVTASKIISSQIAPPIDSATAFQIMTADRSYGVIKVDTTNKRVSIGEGGGTRMLNVRNDSGQASFGLWSTSDSLFQSFYTSSANKAYLGYDVSDSCFKFITGSSFTGATSGICVKDGKVGIGTATPDEILEIDGRLHISEEATPSVPSAGDGGIFYVKSDGKPYFVSATTSEVDLSANPTPDHNDTTNIQGGTADEYFHLTSAELTKLSGIAEGAEVNVQSDWNAIDGDALILNKPSIPASIGDLSDVDITGIAEGQVLTWDTNTSTFLPSDGGTGTVTSVNTQTGDVVLTQDDVGDGTTYVRTENNFTDALSLKLGGLVSLVDKGSLVVGNGSGEASLSVGSNGYVLTADSNAANGVKWAEASGQNTSLAVNQVSHGFDDDFIYHDGIKWYKAIADDEATTATHFAIFKDANNFTAVQLGEVDVTGYQDDLGNGLEVGEYYYLSQTVAGKMVRIAPTSGIAQVVGKVNALTSMSVTIRQPYNADESTENFVKLSTDQTIADVKTFSSFPITPSSAPTTDYQVANKKFVDDKTHNSLASLQGGTAGEYYHLTSAQYTDATQFASATVNGLVSTVAQKFSGVKTFASPIKVQGAAADNTNTAYVEFVGSTGTRTGYVGDDDSTADITLLSTAGGLKFYCSNAVALSFTAAGVGTFTQIPIVSRTSLDAFMKFSQGTYDANFGVTSTGTACIEATALGFAFYKDGFTNATLSIDSTGYVTSAYNIGVRTTPVSNLGVKIKGTTTGVTSGTIYCVDSADTLTFSVDDAGNAYVKADMSVLTFTDRTPYPYDLQTAIDAVNSMEKLPDGEYDHESKEHQLDHTKLHPYISSGDYRDMSASVSCINEVVKHLLQENQELKDELTYLKSLPSTINNVTVDNLLKEVRELNAALGLANEHIGDE